MEEFSQLSCDTFETHQQFWESRAALYSHETITIDALQDGSRHYRKDYLDFSGLVDHFKQRYSVSELEKLPTASLQLGIIVEPLDRGDQPDVPLVVPKDKFFELIDCLQADHTVLWLLPNRLHGLHHFVSGNIETCYFGLSSFTAIWTFDKVSLRTKALFFIANEAIWDWLSELLQRCKNHIESPMLLPYAIVLAQCCAFDRQIMCFQSYHLATIEHQIGYGKHSHKLEERIHVTNLASAIRDVGRIMNDISVKQRSYTIFEDALAAIEHKNISATPGDVCERTLHSNEHLLASFPSLRARIQSSHEYLDYLHDKADRLSSVVYVSYLRPDDPRRCSCQHRTSRVKPSDSKSIETG
ncbi:hypothetical protein GGR57DRAFT_495137 [Xylariaceae sp. FL1272]|nr:hypothetical protein GGR57DRAFT_495137 [Xylariaceae sp. FL1272]